MMAPVEAGDHMRALHGSRSERVGRADVLGPHAESDEPRGNPAQDGVALQQAHGKRKRDGRGAIEPENGRQDVLLDGHLRILRHPRRQKTPLLNGGKVLR